MASSPTENFELNMLAAELSSQRIEASSAQKRRVYAYPIAVK